MKKDVAAAAKVLMFDAFALFNLERAFALDEAALHQRYLALQREFHPDRSPENKIAMLQKSADINKAYQILKNPVSRAEHLLIAEEKPNQELLMEAMEQREALAEATTQSALDKLKKENVEAIKDCILQLEKNLDAQTVLRLKYLTKFSEELRLKALEVA